MIGHPCRRALPLFGIVLHIRWPLFTFFDDLRGKPGRCVGFGLLFLDNACPYRHKREGTPLTQVVKADLLRQDVRLLPLEEWFRAVRWYQREGRLNWHISRFFRLPSAVKRLLTAGGVLSSNCGTTVPPLLTVGICSRAPTVISKNKTMFLPARLKAFDLLP